MDFGKTSFKDQKSLYSQNDTKAHGPIPMVILSHQIPWLAHDTLSHFSAHESYQGNFGSHGLEGQEVYSKKPQ